MAGNFAGDFYKGNLAKFDHLPQHILNGIKLHRFIDNFTDTSPIIKEIGQIFKKNDIKKVAFIASDILLDHYLTKNWHAYSPESFKDFINLLYAETDTNLPFLTAEFCFLYNRLKENEWLFQYSTEEGIEDILNQFAKRIGFQNDLPKCMSIYQSNKNEIDMRFKEFMEDIKSNAARFISQSQF